MKDINGIVAVRFAYLAVASAILIARLVPALQHRFLDYGARSSTSGSDKKSRTGRTTLDRIAEIHVPHNWFASFYAISVTCSLFWAADFLTQGPVVRSMAASAPVQAPAMAVRQVAVVWGLMLIQGSRRLYECIVFSNSSKSQMWIGHWAVGIFFYVTTSIAVWIEGAASLLQHRFTKHDATLTGPDLRMFLGVNLFMFASGIQYDCHAYLASLKAAATNPKSATIKDDYLLPEHPAFKLTCTPHYFAECLIYLALAFIAAPPGQLLNWTLASGLIFVVVNLGITAEGTKKWYERKFGAKAVAGRARMIPYLF